MYNSESTTKICTKCGTVKSISLFFKNLSYNDGLSYWCKSCFRNDNIKYTRSLEGFISATYSSQKRSSKKRLHKYPNYTKKELKIWLLSQKNFKELWSNWVLSGYDKMLRPSCDRTDNSKSYCLTRLNLTTWKENKDNGHRDKKNGLHCSQSKPVKGINIKSGKIVEFHSINHAERELGIDQAIISKVCLGIKRMDGRGYLYTPKTAGGYRWEFLND